MPIYNGLGQEIPPFPPDFLAWVSGLHHKRFKLQSTGVYYTFEFDSGQYQRHLPKHRVAYTFSVISADIIQSPDWRRLIAWKIRSVRFACRRMLRAEAGLEFKKPKYPWA